MGKLSDRGYGRPGEWQALGEESRSKSGNKGPLVGALERRGDDTCKRAPGKEGKVSTAKRSSPGGWFLSR